MAAQHLPRQGICHQVACKFDSQLFDFHVHCLGKSLTHARVTSGIISYQTNGGDALKLGRYM